MLTALGELERCTMTLRSCLGWFALVSSAFVSTCHARAIWTECQGCSQWNAKSIAEQGLAPATRVIFDAAQNVAWKYDVLREQVGQNCQIQRPGGSRNDANGDSLSDTASKPTVNAAGECQWANVAYSTFLDSDDLEIMALLHDAYLETGGTWKSSRSISRDDIFVPDCAYCVTPSGSGYDVVNDMMYRSQLRTSVNDYLRSIQQPTAKLIDGILQGLEISFLGGDMTITVMVTFADGTIVPVVFDDQNPMGFIDPDRVTDENGNALMNQGNRDAFAHFGAVYRTADAAENFLRNAERLGVPVTRAHGGGGRTVSCTWECERTACNLKCSSQ